jgi:hypothetical protein
MPIATGSDLDLGAIERTGKQLHLDLHEIATILGVDQSTLYRWRQGESTPRPLAQTRLVQFAELLELLRRLFAGPDLARRWLHEARPASLGGTDTPLAVMLRGRIDRVLMLLHTLAAGG